MCVWGGGGGGGFDGLLQMVPTKLSTFMALEVIRKTPVLCSSLYRERKVRVFGSWE